MGDPTLAGVAGQIVWTTPFDSRVRRALPGRTPRKQQRPQLRDGDRDAHLGGLQRGQPPIEPKSRKRRGRSRRRSGLVISERSRRLREPHDVRAIEDRVRANGLAIFATDAGTVGFEVSAMS
jgi:hypothetical protein